MTNGNYEVGYRKPPKAGRWKKGQSGNPSGGKKRRRTAPTLPLLECLAEELSETVEITVHGRKTKIPFSQALSKKLLHDLMAAPVKERIKAIESLQKLGVLDLQMMTSEDDDYESCFTEEDRRILAAITGERED